MLPIIFQNSLQLEVVTWGLEFLGSHILNHQCHLEINLSAAIPTLHTVSHTENVNGVHARFFENQSHLGSQTPLSDSYFVGKVTPIKRAPILLEWALQQGFKLHIYGKVADVPPVSQHVQDNFRQVLERAWEVFNDPKNSVTFHGETTQPYVDLAAHKTLINPSLSEVLCTTTAEALAMGKFVVMPDHPSNHFFKRFRNARFYNTDGEAIELIKALEFAQPEFDPNINELTWESGCDRLLQIINQHQDSDPSPMDPPTQTFNMDLPSLALLNRQ